MRRHQALLTCCTAALISCGCVSTLVAPPNLGAGACVPDPRFPGVWKSVRASQLGPGSVRFSFDCDCTYQSRVRVFLMSLRESGTYAVSEGRLSFSRASGETTTWPFRFESDRLLILDEGDDEPHAYRRASQRTCAGGSEPPGSGARPLVAAVSPIGPRRLPALE
jgi:hypothetical protein